MPTLGKTFYYNNVNYDDDYVLQAQETGSDQKFLDLQGCGAKEGDFPAEQPVTNFFVQDFQIEQSPCARSIPYIGLKLVHLAFSSPHVKNLKYLPNAFF